MRLLRRANPRRLGPRHPAPQGGDRDGTDDDASAAISLPAKGEVVSYAGEAFATAEDVLNGVDEAEFFLPTGDFYDEGDWIVLDHYGWHITHASRHLGMTRPSRAFLGSRVP